jgi:hypothetical protein
VTVEELKIKFERAINGTIEESKHTVYYRLYLIALEALNDK